MAPRWRKSPLPPDWSSRRKAVLLRDRGVCQIQGPRCEGVATEVDHKGPHDDHRLSQLRAVCHTCHATRTGRDARAARRPVPSRRRPEERHPSMIVTERDAREG